MKKSSMVEYLMYYCFYFLMKTHPFLFAGFCVLVVGAIPVRAGEGFNTCMQNPLQFGNFSTYNNVTNFCKCFDYVFSTSFPTKEQRSELGLTMLANVIPQEVMKFAYTAKEKCFGYIR